MRTYQLGSGHMVSDERIRKLCSIMNHRVTIKDDPDWQYFELDGEHGSIWETHPKEIADILLQFA